MGRYRPPSEPKSPYITKDGFERLRAEEKALWAKRREVVKILSAAAAEGDRSENAEYIYRKKQLREMDRRIRYLQTRLPNLKVVDQKPSNCNQVFFGAYVTLMSMQDIEITYRIVGPDEFSPEKNWISMDSPMAKALMKREIDEVIKVRLPEGEAEFEILEVRYD